ncbi:hypothetical protein BpHYR1_017533 [Brachionus plicatilis]|uniref:Uncharacterized protein n=1 Tax=Brachionus plicatilis TaxID=10195 RepID=A0A3M7PFJ2_BRAPC|nr:hypothetical protein BpHYR1_017533 [Brachionus plicatilis]
MIFLANIPRIIREPKHVIIGGAIASILKIKKRKTDHCPQKNLLFTDSQGVSIADYFLLVFGLNRVSSQT